MNSMPKLFERGAVVPETADIPNTDASTSNGEGERTHRSALFASASPPSKNAVLEKLGLTKATVMDILIPRPAVLKDLGLTRTAIARHVVRIEPPLPDMQKHALLNRLRGLRSDGRPFKSNTRGMRL